MGSRREELWSFMHDAALERVESDRVARTVRLIVDPYRLRRVHGWSDKERLVLEMHGVERVGCDIAALFPRPCLVPKDANSEDKERLLRAWLSKARHESVDWGRVEEMAQTGDGGVLDATLSIEEEQFILRMDVDADPAFEGYADTWHIQVVGKRLRFVLFEPPRVVLLEEMRRLGDESWR